jgi:hypothetical protein
MLGVALFVSWLISAKQLSRGVRDIVKTDNGDDGDEKSWLDHGCVP